MTGERYRSRVGSFEIGSALLVALWFSLWRAWPAPPGSGRAAGKPASRTVSYAPRALSEAGAYAYVPVALPRSFSEPWTTPGETTDSRFKIKPGYGHADIRAMLDRPIATQDSSRLCHAVPLKERLAAEPAPLLLRRTATSVEPDAPAPAEKAVRVEVNGELNERGFVPDESVFAEFAGDGAKPWSVAVWVETDAQGRTTHAFIQKSSADPRVNRAALSAVYRARPAKGRVSAKGQVVFSFQGI